MLSEFIQKPEKCRNAMTLLLFAGLKFALARDESQRRAGRLLKKAGDRKRDVILCFCFGGG
jgi:hypothetical protein